MKVITSEDDIVSCFMFESVEHILDSENDTEEDRRILSGHCSIHLKEVMHKTDNVCIFKNGNLSIRMFHVNDRIPISGPMSIDDFIDIDSRGLQSSFIDCDKSYKYFRTSVFDCPRISGVNYPLGIAMINTHSGIPILGTVHYWRDTSLFDLIDQDIDDDTKNKTRDDIVNILVKISQILYDIHQSGYIHTDIKPENILLDDSLNPYIADIDSFRRIGTLGDKTGTGSFMSPETMAQTLIGPEVDTMGLALMIYDLLIDDITNELDMDKISENNYCHKYFVSELVSLTKKLLKDLKNPVSVCVLGLLSYRPRDARPYLEAMKLKLNQLNVV